MSEQFDDGLLAVCDYRRSETLGKLAEALAKAQGAIEGARKDAEGQVGQAKRKYADLASVWAACKKALTDNCLAVIQVPAATATAAGVSTLLTHASGEWVSGTLLLPVARRDAQGMGSAITYARRYALMAFVGITPEDDDGEGAGQQPQQRQPARQTQQKPAPTTPARPDIEAAHMKVKQLSTTRGLSGVWGLALTACGLHPGDGWQPPRNKAEAVQALGHLSGPDVARVEKWLDQQLALPAPAQEPERQPAQAEPPAAAGGPADRAETRQLVGAIDAALRRRNLMWAAGLKKFGAHVPANWAEPADFDDALARVPLLATLHQLRRLAHEVAPKGKQAPGSAQPAA